MTTAWMTKESIKTACAVVYNRVLTGESVSGWMLAGNGFPVPTQHLQVTSAHHSDTKCECGRNCDYIFDVSLPIWLTEALGDDVDVDVSLAQDCLGEFCGTFADAGGLADYIKKTIKTLRSEKKHGKEG